MSRSAPRRKARVAAAVIGAAVVVLSLFFVRSPAGIAVLRSRRHFRAHAADARVRYEPGAEREAAEVAGYLSATVRQVEEALARPFKRPFVIYVCSSQASHNRFVAEPSGSPVSGAAILGRVFLAPSAFAPGNSEASRQALMHELVHLHVTQHLGYFRTKAIPVWFGEGLADVIARGALARATDSAAVEEILAGNHFPPAEKGSILVSYHRARGRVGPRMFHAQARLFVGFIRSRDPESFQGFTSALLDGRPWDRAFRTFFGTDVAHLWREFRLSLAERYGHRAEARASSGARSIPPADLTRRPASLSCPR